MKKREIILSLKKQLEKLFRSIEGTRAAKDSKKLFENQTNDCRRTAHPKWPNFFTQ